jgi:hypothetical protein
MDDQENYHRAKKRVEAKLVFYAHAAVYVVVNLLLIIINLTTSTHYLWFKWPIIGWGIALGFHALRTYVFFEITSFKERMIQKELEKERLKKN